jgi:hypothetical protein
MSTSHVISAPVRAYMFSLIGVGKLLTRDCARVDLAARRAFVRIADNRISHAPQLT